MRPREKYSVAVRFLAVYHRPFYELDIVVGGGNIVQYRTRRSYRTGACVRQNGKPDSSPIQFPHRGRSHLTYRSHRTLVPSKCKLGMIEIRPCTYAMPLQ